jgi:L-threonylcarbamoyladenylate synthase
MKVFHTSTLSERDFSSILTVLDAGGVIGYPTDTVYGLGADPFNVTAIREIFRMKGRPELKPILLLVNSISMVERVARPTPLLHTIAEHYWPGPLTLVLPAQPSLPDLVTGGTGTVGLRWPRAAFAKRLLDARDTPITATSANRSGMPAAVTAEEVQKQLGNEISILIDAGVSPSTIASTLLDITTDTPVLLREGPIRLESLREFLGGRIRMEDR